MVFTADFETTTNPADCRVWAYGLCEIDNPNNFLYGNSINDLIQFCKNDEHTLYFHNLKFDGEFILVWLFENNYRFEPDRKKLVKNTFTTLISDKGQFYSMEIVHEEHKTKIFDSLKILPFSVEEVAKGFNLPISKLEIDYHEDREIGHILTSEEIAYLKNDVLIMAMALNILFKQGLNKMTQGSNALHNYKQTVTTKKFNKWFPVPDYDADIRQSYKGGFTYLSPRFKNLDISSGIVLDVNSLYPSVMYYSKLPYGEGIFFQGEYQTDKVYSLYIQMFTCNFELKENHIPTIQLKNNLSFIPNEYVTSSNGEDVTLCLTSVDMALFKEHYNIYNIEYHSGWKFKGTTGLFKEYIDYWNGVKVQSTIDGNKAMRTLAKLMLNALYGKFGLNPMVRSKYPFYENGRIKYTLGPQEFRKPIYIPMASFITAWARYKTITSAQSVYERFIYADTDSLHLVGTDLPENLEIDPTKLGAWKHESTFTRARFIRQKTYMEEIDGKINITCAGMPKQCYSHVTWENFREGNSFEGKLTPKHVVGGIVLTETDFTIKTSKRS